MAWVRNATTGAAAAALIGMCAFTTPAKADWRDWHHHWHRYGWWHGGWGAPAVVVAPRPYYSSPLPPVVYSPPPVIYAPPPGYYPPGVSYGLTAR
jgi:hypothetical protein